MRALDRGRAFIVTRNGVPVGELIPLRQPVFVPADVALAAFAGGPRVARQRFRKDVDAWIDQDPTPRVKNEIDRHREGGAKVGLLPQQNVLRERRLGEDGEIEVPRPRHRGIGSGRRRD